MNSLNVQKIPHTKSSAENECIFIPPATKLGGYIGFTLSVRPSVCLSVCPLTFRVPPVASTVHDGFFPYLVQMINNIRGCVACDDL